MQRDLILDCQFGSTGKGLFASYLAQKRNPDVIAFAPSPNAGHTFWHNGKEVVHKMLPSGITSKNLQAIVLGPGSLLDLGRLAKEYSELDEPPRLYIHENAAVVSADHKFQEKDGNTAPGSTRSGAGAAQADRILRRPEGKQVAFLNDDHPIFEVATLIDTPNLQRIYQKADSLQIESCQGYSLSILHGMYPYCTSRDVTAASILSDCGVPYTHRLTVHGTFRTFPIRVANRPKDGENSGPCYDDQAETTFEAIGQEQEFTTVTKLPRRIFTFSQEQAREACVQSHVDFGFLNFAQYPQTFEELLEIWEGLNRSCTVMWLGFGPRAADVYRIGAPAISKDYVRGLYDQYRD